MSVAPNMHQAYSDRLMRKAYRRRAGELYTGEKTVLKFIQSLDSFERKSYASMKKDKRKCRQ